MLVIQPKLSMSDVASNAIKDGTMKLSGGVIRTSDGKIFEHLKLVNDVNSPNVNINHNNIYLKNGLIIASIVILTYGTHKIYCILNKRKNKKDVEKIIIEIPELSNYLNSIENQKMTIECINNTIDFFENSKKNTMFHDKLLENLRKIILLYTKKLLSINKIKIPKSELKVRKSNTMEKCVEDILSYLIIQKNIFEEDGKFKLEEMVKKLEKMNENLNSELIKTNK